MIPRDRPSLLVIGATDPTGLAGLAVDIQVANRFSVHSSVIVTAVTAQNSSGVLAVDPVADNLLEMQLNCVLSQLTPKVIKIGLLTSLAQAKILRISVQAICQQTEEAIRIIWDPVIWASSGCSLVSLHGFNAIFMELTSIVDVITPNTKELNAIAELLAMETDSEAKLCNVLCQRFGLCVEIKGGHQGYGKVGAKQKYATDRVYSQEKQFAMISSRIAIDGVRGTGCSFAASLAAAKALSYPLDDSLILAKMYLNMGINEAKHTPPAMRCVAHTRSPDQFPAGVIELPKLLAKLLPKLMIKGLTLTPRSFAPAKWLKGLYPIVDNLAWLQRMLELGVTGVQLRIKQQQALVLEQTIADACKMASAFDTALFINDHWQLAIQYGADGVHLGQQDIVTADLQAIADAGLQLGISTHGYYELLIAKQLRPSYIALGHIFPTQTKVMPSLPQGLTRLRQYQSICEQIPTVAIGGINLNRVASVSACGVNGIAVVSAITQATDWQRTVKRLQQEFFLAQPSARLANNTGNTSNAEGIESIEATVR